MSQTTKEIKKIGINKLWSKKIMSPCLKNVLLALLVLSKTFSNFASNNNASSLWQIILYGRTTTGCC